VSYKLKIHHKALKVLSPLFIFDEDAILKSVKILHLIKRQTNCKILFAVKSCALPELLEIVGRSLDGFAASSAFETMWIHENSKSHHEIHLTTPALDPHYENMAMSNATHISFNSIHQYQKYAPARKVHHFHPQIRINPLLSFVKDDRYNPCAAGSKLGVSLHDLIVNFNSLDGLQGIHLHTNCDCTDLKPLLQLVDFLDGNIPDILKRVHEINLGGGYIFTGSTDLLPLYEAIEFLQNKYALIVTIEPGASISRSAAFLKVTVLDLFQSSGMNVAIIDTSVNALPEVFEYQYKHELAEESIDGKYVYSICGMTCLAGDRFGSYCFNGPLKIGDQLTFTNCGCYSLVKAHMFNGVNLPAIYFKDHEGQIRLVKEYNYNDWKMRWQ